VKGRATVWVRTDRVEARLERASLRRDATRIARATGVDPDTLIREAELLMRRARATGAITHEQITVVVAAELGIDPDQLRVEAERLATMRSQ
jgi:hypothetical protein